MYVAIIIYVFVFCVELWRFIAMKISHFEKQISQMESVFDDEKPASVLSMHFSFPVAYSFFILLLCSHSKKNAINK